MRLENRRTPRQKSQGNSSRRRAGSARTAQLVSQLAAVPRWFDEFAMLEVRTPHEARVHEAAWSQLADESVEPNSFYEPWALLPVWETEASDSGVSVGFLYRTTANHPPLLVGVFPLEPMRKRGLPLRAVRCWQHDQCFLTSPLLRRGFGSTGLASCIEWLRVEKGVSLWELPRAGGDGPFAHALVDALRGLRLTPTVLEEFNRAAIRPAATFDEYAARAFSRDQRQENRRKRRRLAEQGTISFRVSSPDDDPQPWLNGFLELEQAGWKGEQKTALAQHERWRHCLFEYSRSAWTSGRFRCFGLFLDGRALALGTVFVSQKTGIGFKIAYDEAWSRFSPGVLMFLDLMEWLHKQQEITSIDSAALPYHPMVNRLWTERRLVRRLVIPCGSTLGRLAGGLWPLIRAVRGVLRTRTTDTRCFEI